MGFGIIPDGTWDRARRDLGSFPLGFNPGIIPGGIWDHSRWNLPSFLVGSEIIPDGICDHSCTDLILGFGIIPTGIEPLGSFLVGFGIIPIWDLTLGTIPIWDYSHLGSNPWDHSWWDFGPFPFGIWDHSHRDLGSFPQGFNPTPLVSPFSSPLSKFQGISALPSQLCSIKKKRRKSCHEKLLNNLIYNGKKLCTLEFPPGIWGWGIPAAGGALRAPTPTPPEFPRDFPAVSPTLMDFHGRLKAENWEFRGIFGNSAPSSASPGGGKGSFPTWGIPKAQPQPQLSGIGIFPNLFPIFFRVFPKVLGIWPPWKCSNAGGSSLE